MRSGRLLASALLLVVLFSVAPVWSGWGHGTAPRNQTPEQAAAKSTACVSCHGESDSASMHVSEGVILGCTDCHGGNAGVRVPEGMRRGSLQHTLTLAQAHVLARDRPPTTGNPVRSYTWANRERPEYLRFVNPGDYRVARESCGACHADIVQAAERSLMATAAMFWGGAAYNNGVLPFKNYILGEAYTREGLPASLLNPIDPDAEMLARGILPSLVPLPTWQVVPAADNFRALDPGGRRGGSAYPEVAQPNLGGVLDPPGDPLRQVSARGLGTGLRSSGPVMNIHKTRLNDPNTWFLGTNDQPGDYRSSGCSGCHVVYANDRNPRHAGPYAQYGHQGRSQSVDRMLDKEGSGHPLRHQFTKAIPTSQCMVCHMHQPNMFVNSYLGYTMWDYESDAPGHVAQGAGATPAAQRDARSERWNATQKAPWCAGSGAISSSPKNGERT